MQQKCNIIITVALFLVLSGCNGNLKNSGAENAWEWDAIQLKDLSGKTVNPGLYSGKTIFINFWATWCKPCLEEMPSIQAARDKLEKENIVFLMASDEPADDIEQFKAEKHFDLTYLRIENMEALNIVGLPTTMIFNASGKQAFSKMGFRNWDSPENIDLLLQIIKSK